MPTKKEQIVSKALEILGNVPDGVKLVDLVKKLMEELPFITEREVRNSIWDLDIQRPEEIYKPVRGVFKDIKYRDISIPETPLQPKTGTHTIDEEDFYQPFADWLVKGLFECTKAIKLGGNKFKDKWQTPDVIGKYESRDSDIVKTTTEIVSAEIKADTNGLITAFGQACAYKLFSHKSYIVIPKNSSDEDKDRLEALCLISGIGLVLFDVANPEDPLFEIRTRAIKHEPDMFYVNYYMKIVENELFL